MEDSKLDKEVRQGRSMEAEWLKRCSQVNNFQNRRHCLLNQLDRMVR